MMGLVYEWLSKIGLAEVAPTFDAAGIVTPKDLATLNVSYYESLGIDDPIKRRKLFLLSQRVKLALNKQGTFVDDNTTEEAVDALIMESLMARRNGTAMNDHLVQDETIQEEKKTDVKPSFESLKVLDRRRSKRLAAKTQGDNNDDSKSATISATDASSSKKKDAAQNTTSAKNPFCLDSDDGVESDFEKAEVVPAIHSGEHLAQTATHRKMQKQISMIRCEERLVEPSSKLPVSARTGKPLSAIPSESTAPPSPLTEYSSFDLNENIDQINKRRVSKRDYVSKLTRASKPTRETRRATLAGSVDELEELLRSSTSESSMSMKLDCVLADLSDSDNERDSRSNHSRPQNTSSSRSIKSMSSCDTVRLKTNQVNQQMERRESTSIRLLDRRQSFSQLSRSDSITQSSSVVESSGTVSSMSFVRGMSQQATWAEQIEDLREDTKTEYELFCDQSNSQDQEYLDMRIRVIVRKRPMSKSESNSSSGLDIIHPLDYGDYGKILVYQPKTRVDLTKEIETIPFAFDHVYGENSTNVQIYERSLRNLIRPFFDGQWATCFAYGQTGSGKTYTMMGSSITGINSGTAKHDDSNLGLYYLAALDIFELLKDSQYSHLSIHASLFEIYGGGKLFDLLNERKQIKCLEDNNGKVCFPGLTQHHIHSPSSLMDLIQHGSGNRSTGTTSRNADSSRSHAVLQVKLTKKVGRNPIAEHSRFSFIDLAGSERGADTSNSDKTTRLEGADINTSLLALKEVIRALATGDSVKHIPFRGSKLTQVLKDSFVGDNARCCMVACISPDIGNCEQTLNTLRYADRVKERNAETGALSPSFKQGSGIEIGNVVPGPLKNENRLKTIDIKGQAQNTDITNSSRTTSQQQFVLELLPDHRVVTQSWLEMLQNETALAHTANDEQGWQDYLIQLEQIQSKQLSFISTLRNSLQAYIDVRAPTRPSRESADEEDSFEDLRD